MITSTMSFVYGDNVYRYTPIEDDFWYAGYYDLRPAVSAAHASSGHGACVYIRRDPRQPAYVLMIGHAMLEYPTLLEAVEMGVEMLEDQHEHEQHENFVNFYRREKELALDGNC